MAGVLPAVGAEYRPARRDLGFPVYTNQPPGRQLSGPHAPALTPALSPAEAQARFTTPEGFEVRLFASEPEVVNPVAMTWDERGRLWVVELYEYPLGAPAGATPRDRIKILEDVDADGRADRVHVWADGLNLATGIVLGNGGAYVGQAPHLLFLRDTDGDDRADAREIVKTGFGLQDRHELLNSFTWGPDGYLYMTHGVFTRSQVVDPDGQDADPVLLTAGVARLHLREPRRFEVFAEGTSNPWGVDFDAAGNAFVSACVIEHLFHLVPGGLYDRQAGTPPHPFAYESLHAINDHRHHMAAYAGVHVYQGNQFPAENRGSILMGNIHDNAVHQDRLLPRGSSFVASSWRDLARAHDGWFMPVSTQVGPDGAVWIADWYDRYPCYQNANADPAGVDREHGRIWRVVSTGSTKGLAVPSRPTTDLDLARLPSQALVDLLAHPNAWQRRTAQRLLSERRDDTVMGRLQSLFASGRPAAPARESFAGSPASALDARLAALWTLHTSGSLADDLLGRAAADPEPVIRTWAARLIGERQVGNDRDLELLRRLAGDPDPSVRLAVAVACRQFTSGQLTVDRPPRQPGADVSEVLATLAVHSAKASDPVVSFMIWQATEPLIAAGPELALDWLVENGPRLMPLAGPLSAKATRRLVDLGTASGLTLAIDFIDRLLTRDAPLAAIALDGLLAGREGVAATPPSSGLALVSRLLGHPDPAIAERGLRLGTGWGEPRALAAVVNRMRDGEAPVEDRIRAIQTARVRRSDDVRNALLDLVRSPNPDEVQVAAIEALGEVGGDAIAKELLRGWPAMTLHARNASAAALASRRTWALPLLEEIRLGRISAGDLGASVIRSLVNHRDESVREQARTAIGRFRESSADKAPRVAARRQVVLAGSPDIAAGHEVARQVCLQCHQLYGEGQRVGPDLTGVGRSSLDALLWNIIDPNQVIGAGYEQVEVETRDDRVIAGRLMENTDLRLRLLVQGGREEVVDRTNIRSQRTLESSVMPEGLDEMPDADFRNLIWFILCPPQEGPMTEARREALVGPAIQH